MKKILLAASILAIASSSVMADTKVLHSDGRITALSFTDEFTGKVTDCVLTVGHRADGYASLLMVKAKGKLGLVGLKAIKYLEQSQITGSAGSYDASGFMVKIDDGEIVQYGQSNPTGYIYGGIVDDSFLEELSHASKIIIRAFPSSEYASMKTSVYEFHNPKATVDAYKQCAIDMNL